MYPQLRGAKVGQKKSRQVLEGRAEDGRRFASGATLMWRHLQTRGHKISAVDFYRRVLAYFFRTTRNFAKILYSGCATLNARKTS